MDRVKYWLWTTLFYTNAIFAVPVLLLSTLFEAVEQLFDWNRRQISHRLNESKREGEK